MPHGDVAVLHLAVVLAPHRGVIEAEVDEVGPHRHLKPDPPESQVVQAQAAHTFSRGLRAPVGELQEFARLTYPASASGQPSRDLGAQIFGCIGVEESLPCVPRDRAERGIRYRDCGVAGRRPQHVGDGACGRGEDEATR